MKKIIPAGSAMIFLILTLALFPSIVVAKKVTDGILPKIIQGFTSKTDVGTSLKDRLSSIFSSNDYSPGELLGILFQFLFGVLAVFFYYISH